MPETILYSSIIGSLLVALALGVVLVVLLLREISELNAKLERKELQIADMWKRLEQSGPPPWEA